MEAGAGKPNINRKGHFHSLLHCAAAAAAAAPRLPRCEQAAAANNYLGFHGGCG
jgi:hypothetical protein